MVSGRRRFSEGSATACGGLAWIAARGAAREQQLDTTLAGEDGPLRLTERFATVSGEGCCTRLPRSLKLCSGRLHGEVQGDKGQCVQACKAPHAARRWTVKERVNEGW